MIDRIITTTIKECQRLTGVLFSGEVVFSGRLSSSLGRCTAMVSTNTLTLEEIVRPLDIHLSKNFLKVATEEEIISVLKHEFAHYCTFKKLGRHSHDSKMFKDYCAMLKTCSLPSMTTEKKVQRKYTAYCECCGKSVGQFSTARSKEVKFPQRYSSRCCKSNIRIEQNY